MSPAMVSRSGRHKGVGYMCCGQPAVAFRESRQREQRVECEHGRQPQQQQREQLVPQPPGLRQAQSHRTHRRAQRDRAEAALTQGAETLPKGEQSKADAVGIRPSTAASGLIKQVNRWTQRA